MVLGPKNIPAPRPVKLGRLAGGSWVILDGLRIGEKVIVDGIQKVQPGAPVKPVNAGRLADPTRSPVTASARGRTNAG